VAHPDEPERSMTAWALDLAERGAGRFGRTGRVMSG